MAEIPNNYAWNPYHLCYTLIIEQFLPVQLYPEYEIIPFSHQALSPFLHPLFSRETYVVVL